MFVERRVPALEEGCEVAGWKLRQRERPLAIPRDMVIDHVSGAHSEEYLKTEGTIFNAGYTETNGPFPA